MRWRSIINSLGYRSEILQEYTSQHCDALIALHALKTKSSTDQFRDRFPQRPLAIALTGTDIHGTSNEIRETHHQLKLATDIIVLHRGELNHLDRNETVKATVIVQSAESPEIHQKAAYTKDFRVIMLGHLREVKDPFLAAMASQYLQADSRCRIDHYGGSHSDDMAKLALTMQTKYPRYHWHGERSQRECLRRLVQSHLMLLTSKAEGGPSVISEAIACGVPIIATRIDATIGLLGEDYPGLFPIGDANTLSELLSRAEKDRVFYLQLKSWVDALLPMVSPQLEAEQWRNLLMTWFPNSIE